MSPSIFNDKSELRQTIRTRLEKISPAVFAVESIELRERLQSQMPSAHTILFFAPLPDEPDVWPLLERSVALGVNCALPAFDAATQTYSARQITNTKIAPQDGAPQIVVGKFGVREPAATCAEIPLDQFDLVLVPGMAFDAQGNRLGRGQGFYDRLLENISGVKVGVCLDLQVVEKIPAEAHDARVDFIVTPSRAFRRK